MRKSEVLTVLVKVVEEVLLALQLALDIGREHMAKGPLLAFGGLGGFHSQSLGRVKKIFRQDFNEGLKMSSISGTVRRILLHSFHKRTRKAAAVIPQSEVLKQT